MLLLLPALLFARCACAADSQALDELKKLFETDPTGIYFEYRATAIGEFETEVEEILHKEYKPDLKIEDALRIAIRALARVIKDLRTERIDAAYIGTADKQFVRVDNDKINKILNGKAK